MQTGLIADLIEHIMFVTENDPHSVFVLQLSLLDGGKACMGDMANMEVWEDQTIVPEYVSKL